MNLRSRLIMAILTVLTSTLFSTASSAQACNDGCDDNSLAAGWGNPQVEWLWTSQTVKGVRAADCSWTPCKIKGTIKVWNYTANTVRPEILGIPIGADIAPGTSSSWVIPETSYGCGQAATSIDIRDATGIIAAFNFACGICLWNE
ncbi:MAG: hypothetical protein H6718_00095 [Polyangiaceae bacterium]|nr:hypothetical protein [Polyangiaceae bacterium]